MKTRVMMIDGDALVGEVNNAEELVTLMRKHDLTPDDIWFTIPNDKLWGQMMNLWLPF